jgi:hypothetical protein
MKLRVLVCLLLLAVCAGSAWSQESRGSITGKVTDPQGALIPGASVVVLNTETNTTSRATANQSGYFELTLLNPGKYSVTVEAPGFKKSVRTGLELNVAGRLDIETQLQVGQLAETIEVTAEAPLLDTTTASGGRVIDNRQVMQLPFSDMNPFALSGLAAGMQWTGQPEYRRPFDNGGTSAFNTAGGVGQNEYTIDGAPVTGTGRRVGYVPPSDAVDEFKLETSTFDAAYGHTSGATVNVTTKSGTNTYHGSLYDQHWQQRWNATPHFTRLQYGAQVASGKISSSTQKQGPGRSNNFGGTLGGPVRIPKIYNGRDKLFFFFSYNGIYQKKAETTDAINRTVPKMAWRQGDFSDLLALPDGATKFQIYDPRSARSEGGRVTRTPFPGNRGIPTMNPMYKFYEPLYPKPNDVPGLVNAEGANNYYGAAMPKDERFNSLVNRIDYNLSEKHRLNGRWYWNHRLANEYDWMYETKKGIMANGLTRINKGLGTDYIWAASGATVLNIGVNWTRFNEGAVNSVLTSYKASDVGLPAYVDAKAGANNVLPRITISNIETASAGYPAIGTRGTTGEAKVLLSHIRGNHSLRFGYMERRYWYTGAGPGYSSGTFDFTNSYMRAADNTTTASGTGLGWAAFMMGLPSGMSIDTNDSSLLTTRYRALYVQDDWRVTSKLRLNLGLRYERQGGTTERFNRALAAGFLWDYKPPFADAVQAAYARSPLAELPASQFSVLGGTQYLGTNGVNTWTEGTHRLAPRAGIVYQLNSKTVLRGGYGWFYDTFNVNNDRPSQEGFSQATSTTMTTDLGASFCCGVGAASNLSAGRSPLTDPFPVRADGTRFDAPYGNSLGAGMRWGKGYTGNSAYPRDYQPPAQQRWRIGVQREISKDMVIEASYNGAYSYGYAEKRKSALPQQYWATGNVRNQALDDNLNTNVANPFNIANFAGLQTSDAKLYNYLRTQGFFTSSTIRKQALLRPYPLMGTDLRSQKTWKDSRSTLIYHDLQVQFEKRFSKGFQSSVMYTYATSTAKNWYANEFDPQMTERTNNNTLPHRVVWSSIYELPFGKGRRWVQSGPAQHIVGGWQLSWIYQIQSGPATGDWGNRFFYGDVNNIASLFNHEGANAKDMHVWFDPNIVYRGTGAIPSGFQGFEGRSASQPGSYHVRVFPITMDALRADGIRNWDLKVQRRFRIRERLSTSFSLDMLNATNHTNFAGPNLDPTSTSFGRVTTQRGLSRVIQFNLRVDF